MGAAATQCTIRRSPTITLRVFHIFVVFLVCNTQQNERHTKRIQQESATGESESACELVGPAAHATSYWKRASQAKPAKQRREYDTKATQQKRYHKEERAKLFANARQFVVLPNKKQDSHN